MTLNFVIRRVLTALLTLVLSSALVFSALLIVPGDPVQLILGLNYEPTQYALLKTQLGLDQPPLERFVNWWGGLLRGDMGRSLSLNTGVTELVVTRLPVTMPLVILSSLVSLLIAIPAGIFAARRKGTPLDVMTVALTQTGLAIPSFWLGLMLILLFAVTLGWLPANGWTAWSEDPVRAARSLVLPVLTLALGQAAGLVRMVRGSVLEVMGLDYVRTARSKGLRKMCRRITSPSSKPLLRAVRT